MRFVHRNGKGSTKSIVPQCMYKCRIMLAGTKFCVFGPICKISYINTREKVKKRSIRVHKKVRSSAKKKLMDDQLTDYIVCVCRHEFVVTRILLLQSLQRIRI